MYEKGYVKLNLPAIVLLVDYVRNRFYLGQLLIAKIAPGLVTKCNFSRFVVFTSSSLSDFAFINKQGIQEIDQENDLAFKCAKNIKLVVMEMCYHFPFMYIFSSGKVFTLPTCHQRVQTIVTLLEVKTLDLFCCVRYVISISIISDSMIFKSFAIFILIGFSFSNKAN